MNNDVDTGISLETARDLLSGLLLPPGPKETNQPKDTGENQRIVDQKVLNEAAALKFRKSTLKRLRPYNDAEFIENPQTLQMYRAPRHTSAERQEQMKLRRREAHRVETQNSLNRLRQRGMRPSLKFTEIRHDRRVQATNKFLSMMRQKDIGEVERKNVGSFDNTIGGVDTIRSQKGLDQVINEAIVAKSLQKSIRGWLVRKELKPLRKAICTVQAYVRGRRVRRQFQEELERQRKAEADATTVQAYVRGRRVRRQFQEELERQRKAARSTIVPLQEVPAVAPLQEVSIEVPAVAPRTEVPAEVPASAVSPTRQVEWRSPLMAQKWQQERNLTQPQNLWMDQKRQQERKTKYQDPLQGQVPRQPSFFQEPVNREMTEVRKEQQQRIEKLGVENGELRQSITDLLEEVSKLQQEKPSGSNTFRTLARSFGKRIGMLELDEPELKTRILELGAEKKQLEELLAREKSIVTELEEALAKGVQKESEGEIQIELLKRELNEAKVGFIKVRAHLLAVQALVRILEQKALKASEAKVITTDQVNEVRSYRLKLEKELIQLRKERNALLEERLTLQAKVFAANKRVDELKATGSLNSMTQEDQKQEQPLQNLEKNGPFRPSSDSRDMDLGGENIPGNGQLENEAREPEMDLDLNLLPGVHRRGKCSEQFLRGYRDGLDNKGVVELSMKEYNEIFRKIERLDKGQWKTINKLKGALRKVRQSLYDKSVLQFDSESVPEDLLSMLKQRLGEIS